MSTKAGQVQGVLDRVFELLQKAQIVRIKIEAVSLDSTIVKVHPDGAGALKNGPQAIGKSRGGWSTKIHLVAANARTALSFSLSPGQAHDAAEGRQLLLQLDVLPDGVAVIMDKAYEGNETREAVLSLGLTPVVPPKSNRLEPWEYDRVLYRRRNEVERLFAASQASDEFSRASRSSTLCSSGSSTSRSSSKPSGCVNTP